MAGDHGGNLDAAMAGFGGAPNDWLDLSTGINPVPYPISALPARAWTALPGASAKERLVTAARRFWDVPDDADVLAVPGVSAAIARIPYLQRPGTVHIPKPTYNEHAASFAAAGWTENAGQAAKASVLVQPNNPDGRLWTAQDIIGSLRILDESFCDVAPHNSLMAEATTPGTLILKSFGKFWGLAGLRLGFVIGDPELIQALAEALGPWPVSGPALEIGATALSDSEWANSTRARLDADAARLDEVLHSVGAEPLGGTSLFRLFNVEDAAQWQTRLARYHVWSRIFPYNPNWLRLGLPPPDRWEQLEGALA